MPKARAGRTIKGEIIMNYEKKYKKLKADIKNAYLFAQTNSTKAVLEHILPELRESEDERIRNEIVAFVEQAIHRGGGTPIPQEQEDCWKSLEKQEEPIDKEKVMIGARKDVALSIMDFLDRNTLGMCLSNMECEYLVDAIVNSKWDKVYGYMKKKLEKQWNKNTKDNKPQVNHSVLMQTTYGIAEGEWKGEDWYIYRWAGIIKDNKVIAWIELSDIEKQSKESKVEEAMREVEEKAEAFTAAHQGENADVILAEMRGEIEPKFHEGEWIISNNKKSIYQIIEVKRGIYVIRDNADNHEYHIGIEAADKSGRLWNISDAKAGDVLAFDDSEHILLVKESHHSVWSWRLSCWCHLLDGDFEVLEYHTKVDGLHPATKEQSDNLFAKIHEAGFAFDFEKKELKKIDEEVNGEDYGIDGLWHAQRILEKTLGSVDSYQTDDGILDHKAAITAVKKLYEQKPVEWSEEDEEELEIAIDTLKESGQYGSAKWVQSLKQRIGG
ncbi:MAG: hypothetical protein IJ698_00420 [Prevotella sp.]|nr:hypothetical protein [Prevotella sp.]